MQIPRLARLAPLGLILGFVLAGCCASGQQMSVWDHVETRQGPLIVVYYPDHDTFNARSTSTVIKLDGKRVARMCEGDFVAVQVAPGEHVLSASTDKTPPTSASGRTKPYEPILVVAGDRPVFVRFGARPYVGPASDVSILLRRLTEVTEAKARGEVSVLGLLGPR